MYMPNANSAHLAALRAEFEAHKLDGFLVPMADEYQNEYVPKSAARLKFLTGFTGSAGEAVVLRDQAAFFTDGRYQTQAGMEVDASDYAIFNSAQKDAPNHNTKIKWLVEHASKHAHKRMHIGYDPWLHTAAEIDALRAALKGTGAELVAVEKNPIDAVWKDRPAVSQEQIFVHEDKYAGKNSMDKRSEIAAAMREKGIHAAVITDPASVAWLLNVRGGDVDYTPLPNSFAILKSNGSIDWYVDPAKTHKHDHAITEHMGVGVRRHDISQFPAALGKLKGDVLVDPDKAASRIVETLKKNEGAKLKYGDDPSVLPRAMKNKTEIKGMRDAHIQDGIAMAKFLAWVATTPPDQIDELSAEKKLEQFCAVGKLYCGPSFRTIAATGPNAAVIHYHSEAPNKLVPNSFLLVDSGRQYKNGTTDITRTIAIGEVSQEMKDNYTRVLQGHIRLAMAEFGKHKSGPQLDAIARKPLLDAGLDYGHGTGHGVGSYSSVHEGPQKVSTTDFPQAVKTKRLYPGMVISDEPGYYKTGENGYGIRIENLIYVKKMNPFNPFNLWRLAKREVFDFGQLTMAPYDRNAINAGMLSKEELNWLNRYHRQVYRKLKHHLNGPTRDWLKQATAPIL
jgi:Xaa-Pro aminopeptidase